MTIDTFIMHETLDCSRIAVGFCAKVKRSSGLTGIDRTIVHGKLEGNYAANFIALSAAWRISAGVNGLGR